MLRCGPFQQIWPPENNMKEKSSWKPFQEPRLVLEAPSFWAASPYGQISYTYLSTSAVKHLRR